jgi:hypothetical protein
MLVLKRKKKQKGDIYLPELLWGIFACYTLEDLCAAGVLVDKLGYIEDTVIDDDVEALIGGLVGGHFGGGECLGHFWGSIEKFERWKRWKR